MHSCRKKFCCNLFEAIPYIYWTNTHGSIPIEMGSFPAEKDIRKIHGGIGRHLVVEKLRLKSVPSPTYTWKKVRNVDDESPMPLNRNSRIVQDREGKISHQL